MDLTSAQLTTLKADIQSNTDPVVVAALAAGSNSGVSAWYNGESTFVVYRSLISLDAVGAAFDGSDMGNISSANAERVQIFFTTQPGGVQPERADHRAFFDDVFSGAAGATTRAELDLLWPRNATHAEAVFATGTGTTQAPGQLVVEGDLTSQNVSDALES